MHSTVDEVLDAREKARAIKERALRVERDCDIELARRAYLDLGVIETMDHCGWSLEAVA